MTQGDILNRITNSGYMLVPDQVAELLHSILQRVEAVEGKTADKDVFHYWPTGSSKFLCGKHEGDGSWTVEVYCVTCPACIAAMKQGQNPSNISGKDEPGIVSATVRDGGDDWHIECRFSDGQKFAAITVDKQFELLAHRICEFVNSEHKQAVESLKENISAAPPKSAGLPEGLIKAVYDAHGGRLVIGGVIVKTAPDLETHNLVASNIARIVGHAIAAAVEAEREACAKEAMSSKTHDYNAGIAAAIRRRG